MLLTLLLAAALEVVHERQAVVSAVGEAAATSVTRTKEVASVGTEVVALSPGEGWTLKVPSERPVEDEVFGIVDGDCAEPAELTAFVARDGKEALLALAPLAHELHRMQKPMLCDRTRKPLARLRLPACRFPHCLITRWPFLEDSQLGLVAEYGALVALAAFVGFTCWGMRPQGKAPLERRAEREAQGFLAEALALTSALAFLLAPCGQLLRPLWALYLLLVPLLLFLVCLSAAKGQLLRKRVLLGLLDQGLSVLPAARPVQLYTALVVVLILVAVGLVTPSLTNAGPTEYHIISRKLTVAWLLKLCLVARLASHADPRPFAAAAAHRALRDGPSDLKTLTEGALAATGGQLAPARAAQEQLRGPAVQANQQADLVEARRGTRLWHAFWRSCAGTAKKPLGHAAPDEHDDDAAVPAAKANLDYRLLVRASDPKQERKEPQVGRSASAAAVLVLALCLVWMDWSVPLVLKLAVGNGVLHPPFAPGRVQYDWFVDASTTQLRLGALPRRGTQHLELWDLHDKLPFSGGEWLQAAVPYAEEIHLKGLARMFERDWFAPDIRLRVRRVVTLLWLRAELGDWHQCARAGQLGTLVAPASAKGLPLKLTAVAETFLLPVHEPDCRPEDGVELVAAGPDAEGRVAATGVCAPADACAVFGDWPHGFDADDGRKAWFHHGTVHVDGRPMQRSDEGRRSTFSMDLELEKIQGQEGIQVSAALGHDGLFGQEELWPVTFGAPPLSELAVRKGGQDFPLLCLVGGEVVEGLAACAAPDGAGAKAEACLGGDHVDLTASWPSFADFTLACKAQAGRCPDEIVHSSPQDPKPFRLAWAGPASVQLALRSKRFPRAFATAGLALALGSPRVLDRCAASLAARCAFDPRGPALLGSSGIPLQLRRLDGPMLRKGRGRRLLDGAADQQLRVDAHGTPLASPKVGAHGPTAEQLSSGCLGALGPEGCAKPPGELRWNYGPSGAQLAERLSVVSALGLALLLARQPQLQKLQLDLGGHEVGDDGAELILAALPPSAKSLTLGLQGARQIGQDGPPRVRPFGFGFSSPGLAQLEELRVDLSGNHLGPLGARALGTVMGLWHLRVLTLKLAGTRPTDQGTQWLASLGNLAKLEDLTLDLAQNDLTHAAMSDLHKGLQGLRESTAREAKLGRLELRLDENPIGDDCGQNGLLLDALAGVGVKHLSLGLRGVGLKDAKPLARMVPQASSVLHSVQLDLSNGRTSEFQNPLPEGLAKQYSWTEQVVGDEATTLKDALADLLK